MVCLAQGNLSSKKVLLDEAPLPVRMRATGSKTYHIGRTLMFVPPDEYKKPEKGSLLLKNKSKILICEAITQCSIIVTLKMSLLYRTLLLLQYNYIFYYNIPYSTKA